jgi:5-methyltetrahydropteroyltriglutamate--homocysteine methyltransferase
VEDLRFLRAHTSRTVKITVPGPFTMSQQAQDDYYGSREALALGYAEAVNEEIKDLFAAGRGHRPAGRALPAGPARGGHQYGVKVVNRALEGVTGTTAVHLCFGYAAIIHDRPPATRSCPSWPSAVRPDLDRDRPVRPGLLGAGRAGRQDDHPGRPDLNDTTVETPEIVAARVRRALPYVPAERLVLAPDCGMKYLPRDAAFGKLAAMKRGEHGPPARLDRVSAGRSFGRQHG